MDPAVTAALVAVPASLVAAAAAFAVGRAQALATHRGPVDAVRRPQQREAYASLLSALDAYIEETLPLTESVADGRSHNGGHSGDLMNAPGLDDIRKACSAVKLEGPDDVAAAADGAFEAAVAVLDEVIVSDDVPSPEARGAHRALQAATESFVQLARTRLNDSGL
ncbi:hypothetical protein [Streptomyces sp. NPDC003730]